MQDSSVKNILVAIRNRDDGEIVIEKACRLARKTGAAIHVLRAVHDEFADLSVHDIEQSQELKNYLLQADEEVLRQLAEPLISEGVEVHTRVMWNKSEWQAILAYADEVNAGQIIKGTASPVTEIIRTPTDWNLLRHARVPVMLVKPINWVDSPVVLAAIHATEDEDEELNIRILSRAHHLATLLGGEMHVVSVFPSVEHWVGPITVAIDFDKVRKAVSAKISAQIDQLLAKIKVTTAKIHTVQGESASTIQDIVDKAGAELLVMGTHHRTGPSGIVLGNTSEKILYSVKSDVEVLR